MHISIRTRRGGIVRGLALILTVVLSCAHYAYAAPLVFLSDEMSILSPNAFANHTIKFTTLSGLGTPGHTLTLTFPSQFIFGSVGVSDISLSYGPTGTETTASVGAFAGTGTWGVSIAAPVITFTHPTAGSEIAPADVIIIKIGTHTGGTNRLRNPSVNGSYVIRIGGTFGDAGSLAVPIANATIGVTTGSTGSTGGSTQTDPVPPPTIDEYSCPVFTSTHLLTGTATLGTRVFVNNDSSGVTQYPNGTWDSLRALVYGTNVFWAFAQSTGTGESSTSVSRTIYRHMLGDTNGDMRVDDFDLAGLAAHWEGRWCPGDFNRDDRIDDFDLSILAWYWTE